MKKFILKFVLFLFPLLLLSLIVFTLPVYTIIKTKEYYSIQKMINEQQNENVLVNRSIISTMTELKYYTAEFLKPKDVLAVGTSRVMQFRDLHFNDNVSFYNAGGVAGNLQQYIDYFNKMSFRPEIVIVGLDQYFFNENYAKKRQGKLKVEKSVDFKKLLISSVKLTYSDLSIFTKLNNYPENIGLNAVSFSDGFRPDGSYFYNRILNHPELESTKKMVYPFEDTMLRIDKGNRRFEYGNDVYDTSINQVKELLEICYEKNIYVVAIIPPYAPSVWKNMQSNGHYNYVSKIYNGLINEFNKYNYELYDFTDMADTTDNSMYIDGFHGNDYVYSMILNEVNKRNSRLSKYIR